MTRAEKEAKIANKLKLLMTKKECNTCQFCHDGFGCKKCIVCSGRSSYMPSVAHFEKFSKIIINIAESK